MPPPAALYKFRPYNNDAESKQRSWVRDTLFSHRIRFAKMSELNDPFEGRPYLVPQYNDRRRQQEEIYRTALNDAFREGLTGEAAARQARLAQAAMLGSIPDRDIQRLMTEAILESFWIYCVTSVSGCRGRRCR
jgi:hypothetical protein